MLVAYHRELGGIADAGIATGKEGVKLAGKAVGAAVKGIFSGNPDHIEQEMEAEAKKVEAEAMKICDRLPGLYKAQQELAAALQSSSTPLLVDARPPKFFAGEARTDAAARYGTLPGAKSFDNAQFFAKGASTLKPASELKALVALAGADAAPAVSFCNTGHWAATNWFVMSEIAGNKAVKLYPASVVEWSQAERPMDNQPSRVTALVQDVKRAFDK